MLTILPKTSSNTRKPSEFLTSRIDTENSLSINRRMKNIMPKNPLDFGDAPKVSFSSKLQRNSLFISQRNSKNNNKIFSFDNSSSEMSEDIDSSKISARKSSIYSVKNCEKNSQEKISEKNFEKNTEKASEKKNSEKNFKKKLQKNFEKKSEIKSEKSSEKNIEKNSEKNTEKYSEKNSQKTQNHEKKYRDKKKTHGKENNELIGNFNDSINKNEVSFGKNKLNPFTEKLYELISKFYVIKKFIKNLRNAANVRFPTKYQMNRMFVLNDRCFYKEGFIIQEEKDQKDDKPQKFMMFFLVFIRFLLKIYEFFSNKCNKYLKIFDPAKTMRSLWDGLHLIVLFFYFFKIPVELSFEIKLFEYLHEINENLAEFLNYFGILFLLLDFLVNFNTGYYKKGSLIVKRENIAKHYVKKSFSLILSVFCRFCWSFKNSNLTIN